MTNPQSSAFMVGAHRSGTTLLGLMLDSHPDLSWFHHFEWAVRYIGTNGEWPTTPEYKAALQDDQGYQEWNLSVNDEVASYPDILNGFLEQRRQRDGKPLAGATIHTRYQELCKIWPEARFVHIVRDPRDVVRSTIKAGWSGNAWGAAHRWKAAETQWDVLCNLVPEERRLMVTFEELVTDPTEILKKVTGFLGIPYTDEMFSYTDRTPYSYPDPKMASKWKKNMPPEENAMVELAVGDLLDKYGYERLSGRDKITFPERLQFSFMDRWIKFTWRIGRYGWKLWTAQFIVRLLGSPKQLKWVLRKADEVDINRLKASGAYVVDPNKGSPTSG